MIVTVEQSIEVIMSRIAINDGRLPPMSPANSPKVTVPKLWEKRATLAAASNYPCQQFEAVMIEDDICSFVLTEAGERIDLES